MEILKKKSLADERDIAPLKLVCDYLYINMNKRMDVVLRRFMELIGDMKIDITDPYWSSDLVDHIFLCDTPFDRYQETDLKSTELFKEVKDICSDAFRYKFESISSLMFVNKGMLSHSRETVHSFYVSVRYMNCAHFFLNQLCSVCYPLFGRYFDSIDEVSMLRTEMEAEVVTLMLHRRDRTQMDRDAFEAKRLDFESRVSDLKKVFADMTWKTNKDPMNLFPILFSMQNALYFFRSI
jgi:hypothetical protein